ncbi:DLW-39 family protein [Cellulomonas sp. JH27-2]
MGDTLKKILLLAVVAAAGYVVYTKFVQDRDERDLWAEVTDTFE